MSLQRPVAALILAAGRATRFGAGPDNTKAVALLAGKPLVRHVAEAAMASMARPVVVVTGHAATQVCDALDGLAVAIVHNDRFAEGLATSLRCGLAALPPEAAGALVLLADMPRITTALIDDLIARLQAGASPPLAIVPTHDGQRGNPVLLGRGLFGAVATIDGDQGARRLLDAAGDEVVEHPIDDPAIMLDVDTRAALGGLAG